MLDPLNLPATTVSEDLPKQSFQIQWTKTQMFVHFVDLAHSILTCFRVLAHGCDIQAYA